MTTGVISAGPLTIGLSRSDDGEIEEMGGAADARIMVADGHLGSATQLVVVEIEVALDEMPQIVFDGCLVL
jgi:hypothetical protein